MRIITLQCPTCGTIVAGNVLEQHQEMKCPRLQCEVILKFSDLPAEDREHILSNREKYTME
jgi:phage FluMu protein Com